jgi:hypothetical protein
MSNNRSRYIDTIKYTINNIDHIFDIRYDENKQKLLIMENGKVKDTINSPKFTDKSFMQIADSFLQESKRFNEGGAF